MPMTDVYELYWSHVIRDTTLTQVTSWVRQLMLRRGIPKPLQPALGLLWLLVFAVLVGLVAPFVWDLPWWLSAGSLLVFAAGLLWRLFGRPVTVNVVGDAARYLSPEPGNVAHRQAIREAGVDLLERLHDGGDHDRIVLLGHSLRAGAKS